MFNNTAHIFISLGFKELKRELFDEPLNGNALNKPKGGLWASSFIDDRRISHWHYACSDMELDKELNYGVKFNLKQDARVYVIDNEENALEFFDKYNEIRYSSRLSDIDWKKVREDYDAVYLTHNGLRETKFSFTAMTFCGWDCESIVILNFDIIENQEYWEM